MNTAQPRSTHEFFSTKLEVRWISPQLGHGVFAREPIYEGELLAVCGGAVSKHWRRF